ncbi:hypothetical protein B5F34_07870 [Mediterranea sp. An20]|nr:hypothetical protein B5F34_07870 [Mediterranea sp. An20]
MRESRFFPGKLIRIRYFPEGEEAVVPPWLKHRKKSMMEMSALSSRRLVRASVDVVQLTSRSGKAKMSGFSFPSIFVIWVLWVMGVASG